MLNPEEIEQLWSCPNCGSQMKKNLDTTTSCRVCTQCGCSMDGEEKTFNPGVLCPNCNQELGNKTECPYCGYDLGSDFD